LENDNPKSNISNPLNRQTFIKNSFWTLSSLGLLSILYAWKIEPFWLEFVKVKMPIRNLPKDLVGKTLIQISDIHIGNRFDHHFVIDSFNKAQAFNPDFVVYTGDFVSTYKGEVIYSKLEETLDQLVKGKMATIGILGNHDYGVNWSQNEVADKIASMLTNKGVRVLRNESYEVNGLNFIGFDDFWGLNFDPDKAMNGYDKSKANIALCHNPDVCDLDVWAEYNSWILSGHTHGGQVKPPFLSPPMLPVKNKKYAAGKYDLSKGRILYINRALGHLWQVRFNVRPEITVFELESV
jgi:uncharacterized protein